ncbi:MAG TPA: VOC family protein [Humibacter sp.]|nr:VOC family protein [Humibacter sp.]
MANTILNPYLNFRGDARDAMEFYRSVFGGDLNVSTFGESQMTDDPDEQDWLMHAQLTTPGGLTLMGADVPKTMDFQSGGSISVSLSGDDEDELRGFWQKLSDGAQVEAPFERAPWGDTFGMCVDRFGVRWLVNAAGSAA